MRSHLLPRFYLSHFTDPASIGLHLREPYLWIWNHEKWEWKKRAPQNAATRTNFYKLTAEEEGTGGELERILATIESRTAKLYHAHISQGHRLTRVQRFELSVFVNTLRARLPRQLDEAQSYTEYMAKERVRQELQQLVNSEEARARHNSKTAGAPLSEDAARDLLEHLDEIVIKAPRPAIVANSIMIAHEFSTYLAAMKWSIIKAPVGTHFVTSDNPQKSFTPSVGAIIAPAGFGWPDVQLTCPLSRDLALFATHGAESLQYIDVTAQTVEAVNLRTMMETDNIFAPTLDAPALRLIEGRPIEECTAEEFSAELNNRLVINEPSLVSST